MSCAELSLACGDVLTHRVAGGGDVAAESARSMKRTSRMLLFLLASSVLPAAGQSRSTSQDAALARLRIGQRVRVETTRAHRLEGVVSNIGDRDVSLWRDGEQRSLSLDEMAHLWVRGNAVKTGALVGGLGGLVVGVAWGFLIGEIACAETNCTRLEVAAAAGGVFAVGGTAAGALVGLAIPAWHLRF